MVAVAPPLLSDQPPEVPRRAGLGDRFHYFRGVSGRRYLFSTVSPAELGDFHSAVAILARRAGRGLAAYSVIVLDRLGRPVDGGHRLRTIQPDSVALVHLLTTSDSERRELVADLVPLPMALAA